MRYVRGNSGNTKRKYAKSHARPNGRAGETFALPDSMARPWSPHILAADRVLVLSDLHVPYHDRAAIELAVEAGKRDDPDAVLINGDFGDWTGVSRWDRPPDAPTLAEELVAMRNALGWIVSQFPRALCVFKSGNHEEWLEKFVWAKAPELFGIQQCTLAHLLTTDDNGKPIKAMRRVEFVGDQRPIMLGKLVVFHGHELPKGLTNSVNPARGAFLRTTDTVLIGHHHRSSSHTEYTWHKQPIATWSTGCLCDMHPRYARINKWNHGHAVVEVDRGGNFDVRNYQHVGGKAVAA